MKSWMLAARVAASSRTASHRAEHTADSRGWCRGRDAFLRHHADLLAERVERDAAHIVPVDQDPPADGVIEPRGHQVNQRRLPGAARPDQGDELARLHCEADIFQRVFARLRADRRLRFAPVLSGVRGRVAVGRRGARVRGFGRRRSSRRCREGVELADALDLVQKVLATVLRI